MTPKEKLMQIIANPSGFSIKSLKWARDELFDPDDDSELGKANQKHRDMLTKEINAR